MTQEDKDRYNKALSNIRLCVGTALQKDPTQTSHVSLRNELIGISSANVATAKLLLQKGIITKDEYEKSLADELEAEVKRYDDLCLKLNGKRVELK